MANFFLQCDHLNLDPLDFLKHLEMTFNYREKLKKRFLNCLIINMENGKWEYIIESYVLKQL